MSCYILSFFWNLPHTLKQLSILESHQIISICCALDDDWKAQRARYQRSLYIDTNKELYPPDQYMLFPTYSYVHSASQQPLLLAPAWTPPPPPLHWILSLSFLKFHFYKESGDRADVLILSGDFLGHYPLENTTNNTSRTRTCSPTRHESEV